MDRTREKRRPTKLGIPALLAIACLLPGPGNSAAQLVTLRHDSTRLTVFVNVSGLAIVSTDRPFAAGVPFFLLPESPFGFKTNTFDLHARQSSIGLLFTGPRFKGLTPSALFVAYFENDNLVADAYGVLPYLAFGELRNEKWRFAAGLNLDVFNPLNPTVIPVSLLYGSGNAGTYRGQVRLERFIDASEDARFTFQFAVGEPVASVVTDNRRILEDNGWPNVELRMAAGLGAMKERMGDRKLRSLELGVSGVIGQLRTTGIITVPGQPELPDREVVEVLGLGLDATLTFTRRFGLIGEAYIGEGLGEYAGGVLQSFNPITSNVIESQGGFAEAYVYILDNLHIHGGYAVDNPDNDELLLVQIPENRTGYATLYWDLSKFLQLSLEAEFRKTNYFEPLLTADGMIFMSQILFRF